jgi:CheY-like chemotaxis protein
MEGNPDRSGWKPGWLLRVWRVRVLVPGVVVRARAASDALEVINRCAPDVAVLDIRMPPTFTDEGLRIANGSAPAANTTDFRCFVPSGG